jgi:hypothetical protein
LFIAHVQKSSGGRRQLLWLRLPLRGDRKRQARSAKKDAASKAGSKGHDSR